MKQIILTVIVTLSIVFSSAGQIGDSRSDMDMIFKSLSSINHKGRYVNYTEGSPYYRDNWLTGNIILPSGKKYEGILLKLDLLYNEVHYQSPQTKGDAAVSAGAIKEVQLQETGGYTIFRIGYPAAYGNDSTTFYKVMTEGKATLLKLYTKRVDDGNAFDPTKKIKLEESYFLFTNNNLIKIKNGDSFVKAFPEHKNEIATFIKEKKLNLKDEAHLKEMADYCNKL